jgi:hypothetical protein
MAFEAHDAFQSLSNTGANKGLVMIERISSDPLEGDLTVKSELINILMF